jgi:hypothetical protein
VPEFLHTRLPLGAELPSLRARVCVCVCVCVRVRVCVCVHTCTCGLFLLLRSAVHGIATAPGVGCPPPPPNLRRYWGAALAVTNNTQSAVTVVVDCSKSENTVNLLLAVLANARGWAARACWGVRLGVLCVCSCCAQESHRGTLVTTLQLPPRDTKLAHYLLPKERAPWSWGFSISLSGKGV